MHGSNVAVSSPDANAVIAGSRSLDFLVVCDFFLSETAAEADLVLPVTQWAEEEGTMTNLEGRVLRRRRAITPPAGVRERAVDHGRAGRGASTRPATFGDGPRDVFEELRLASAGGLADYSGIDYAHAGPRRGRLLALPRAAAPARRACSWTASPTPTGMRPARRRSSARRGRPTTPRPADAELTLITGRLLEHYQSGAQTRRVPELAAAQPEALAAMHPAAAGGMGIADGDAVSSSPTSAARCAAGPAEHRHPARRRCSCRSTTATRRARTCLTSDAVDPISAMPEFKTNVVRVRGSPPAAARSRSPRMTALRIVLVGFGPVAARLVEELLPAVRAGAVS